MSIRTAERYLNVVDAFAGQKQLICDSVSQYFTAEALYYLSREVTPEAAIEDAMKKLLEPAAKERKKATLKKGPEKPDRANLPARKERASDSAAASLNVSRKSVDHASTVIANGSPELIESVDRGEN